MTSRRYQLRFTGLKESRGEIRTRRLVGVLRGLAATAARSIQLRATGSGRITKSTPSWIKSTTDFTVTSIVAGSTTVGIAAPCLRTTACDQFSQFSLWGEKPELDDTGLDLATVAINEAATAKPAGNYFDDAVLGAILKLVKACCNSEVRVELSSAESKHSGFVIDSRLIQDLAEKRKKFPPSKAFIVCGRLTKAQDLNSYFRLILKDDSALVGRLNNPSSHLEVLRSLQGEKVTLEGIVSFKINREARVIETRKIRKYTERDAFFEEVPKGEFADVQELILAVTTNERRTKFTDLFGLWPGDETSEELLAELKASKNVTRHSS